MRLDTPFIHLNRPSDLCDCLSHSRPRFSSSIWKTLLIKAKNYWNIRLCSNDPLKSFKQQQSDYGILYGCVSRVSSGCTLSPSSSPLCYCSGFNMQSSQTAFKRNLRQFVGIQFIQSNVCALLARRKSVINGGYTIEPLSESASNRIQRHMLLFGWPITAKNERGHYFFNQSIKSINELITIDL